jgi:hypothetical protein
VPEINGRQPGVYQVLQGVQGVDWLHETIELANSIKHDNHPRLGKREAWIGDGAIKITAEGVRIVGLAPQLHPGPGGTRYFPGELIFSPARRPVPKEIEDLTYIFENIDPIKCRAQFIDRPADWNDRVRALVEDIYSHMPA